MDLTNYEPLVVQHAVPGVLKHLQLEMELTGSCTWNLEQAWCEWKDHGRYRIQWLGQRGADHKSFRWAWAHPGFEPKIAAVTELALQLKARGHAPFTEPVAPLDPVEVAVVAGELGGACAVFFLNDMAMAVYDFPLQVDDGVSTVQNCLETLADHLESLKDRTLLRAAFAHFGWATEGSDTELSARHRDGTAIYYVFDEEGEIVKSWTEQPVDEWVDEAERLVEAGALDQAEALLMRARDAQPKHYKLNITLYELARARKDWEQAHRWLRQAHRHHPDQSLPLYYMGRVSEELGDWDKALGSLREYLVRKPGDPYALAILGRVLGKKGETDEGIAALEASLQARPSDYNFYTLAKLYRDPAKAITALEEAVRLDPKFALYWRALGDRLVETGAKARARECYERALALDPESSAARKALSKLDS